MRGFLIIALLASTTANAAPLHRKGAVPAKVVPAPPTQPFEFKGYVAGQTVTPDREKCTTQEEYARYNLRYVPGICSGIVDNVIAGSELTSVRVGLYNHKLSTVSIFAVAGFWPKVSEALEQKYGKPCEVRLDKWQNLIGVSVDNAIMTWCFSTGKLVLKERSSQYDYMTADYTDANQPPAEQPKVDF